MPVDKKYITYAAESEGGGGGGETGPCAPPKLIIFFAEVSTTHKFYSGRHMIQVFVIVPEATWPSQLL